MKHLFTFTLLIAFAFQGKAQFSRTLKHLDATTIMDKLQFSSCVLGNEVFHVALTSLAIGGINISYGARTKTGDLIGKTL